MPARPVATVDIILDFELGRLNAEVKGSGTLPEIAKPAGNVLWRSQILSADGERILNENIARFTAGATLYKTRGFYNGAGAPGYVIRLIGSGAVPYLYNDSELLDVGRCLAHTLKTQFDQWDVWLLFTDSQGRRSLRFAADEGRDAPRLYAACRRHRAAAIARASAS